MAGCTQRQDHPAIAWLERRGTADRLRHQGGKAHWRHMGGSYSEVSGRKECSPSTRSWEQLFYFVAQALAGFEFHDLGSRDGDLFACSGIAPFTLGS